MKKFLSILMVSVLLLCMCGCTNVSIQQNTDATLIFKPETSNQAYNIEQELTKDEANTIISIFNGKERLNAITSGMPSCGFDPNVSIRIGTTVYEIAMDTCGTVHISGTLDYLDISNDEAEIIHEIFEKYGGFFPCI